MRNENGTVIPVNWNNCPEFELTIWNKLTSNFWLPEKIALANDLQSWSNMSDAEKDTTMKVFAGLTLLDTIQGSVGMISLIPDAQNPFEEAILQNIVFMEAVHAKSYSSIFSTLSNTRDIDEAFRWSEENVHAQYKAKRITDIYDSGDADKKKIASVFLESGLFFSGFYWPIYLASRSKLTNTNDIIMLILRDEAIHGYAIGQWYQQHVATQSEERQAELKDFIFELFFDLFENEVKYTRSLYDPLGLTEEVISFVKYNFNKAMQNLGFDSVFSAEESRVAAPIMASLSPDASANHDFFSGSGSTYIMGTAEETQDEDWDF